MQAKFDLSDWDRRKAALLPVIDAAAVEGLVAQENVGRLSDFLLGRGIAVGAVPAQASAANGVETLDTPIASERSSGLEDSEAPRFVRGFHDILISIGIVIGLSGLVGLATFLAVFPAVIVLGEILVRRQRLALPAVVLTLSFIAASVFGMHLVFEEISLPGRWQPALSSAMIMGLLALFYWRYRVPLAFALMCIAAFAVVVFVAAAMIFEMSGNESFFDTYPTILAGLIGLFAVLTFGTALYFDFSDRFRATRRSDVAFWLHLAAAPAILYTVITLVYAPFHQSWFDATTSASQAGTIVFTVLVLMLVGIMLDRRAFVTSGLLSFGYAFKILLDEGGVTGFLASADNIAFVILLATGVIVLSLGIGWRWLRRVALDALPSGVAQRLPLVQ